MWRISRSDSIIIWQDYRVSTSRLAESNFRHTQGGGKPLGRRTVRCHPGLAFRVAAFPHPRIRWLAPTSPAANDLPPHGLVHHSRREALDGIGEKRIPYPRSS